MPPKGRIKAPANLPELVRATFNRAKASGDVLFYPTQVAVISVNSIPFQLRFAPALASKPKPPQPSTPQQPAAAAKKPAFDPFDNPDRALVVTRLQEDHILVLNKFAIVPEHFILATTTFELQTDLLPPADLAAARACIDAYNNNDDNDGREGPGEEKKNGLFVFYNSGEHSGASQPHRHLQLLPVDRMRDGLPPPSDGASSWDVLVDSLLDPATDATTSKLPFPCFAERLPPSTHVDDDDGGAVLHETYTRLYRAACAAVLGGGRDGHVNVEIPASGASRISYNLAMTRDVMALCPRTAEGAPVVHGDDGAPLGQVSLNGTVLAGTALVKTQAEFDAITQDPSRLRAVLERIGAGVQAPVASSL